MYLPGREIIRRCIIDTPAEGSVQPASVDLRIGKTTLYLKARTVTVGQKNAPEYVRKEWDRGIEIKPGQFLLAATMETVSVPAGLVAEVSGKSSLARIGLAVHITAGWVDPGFSGPLTLELKNVGPAEIVIPINSFICQLAVAKLEGYTFPDTYKGKYRGADGVQGARW